MNIIGVELSTTNIRQSAFLAYRQVGLEDLVVPVLLPAVLLAVGLLQAVTRVRPEDLVELKRTRVRILLSEYNKRSQFRPHPLALSFPPPTLLLSCL